MQYASGVGCHLDSQDKKDSVKIKNQNRGNLKKNNPDSSYRDQDWNNSGRRKDSLETMKNHRQDPNSKWWHPDSNHKNKDGRVPPNQSHQK